MRYRADDMRMDRSGGRAPSTSAIAWRTAKQDPRADDLFGYNRAHGGTPEDAPV
ncbi:hypothetical protein GTS_07050 [Gandjariella thermophila]|uniref:Uncharacterized protein n=1 Tax=Gandjariella thermophila TaxID=1931992 RepID=A0A4D4J1V6_9PSEU|nr:hypothetical protein GTS_07050 [Gandjariella thermophila]